MILIQSIIIACMCSVMGYVYAAVLVQPDEILGSFYAWYRKFFVKKIEVPTADVPDELIGFIKPSSKIVLKEKEMLILKALGGCEKCTAGQMSLWVFIAYSITIYGHEPVLIILLNHIFTICLTILLTLIITKALRRL